MIYSSYLGGSALSATSFEERMRDCGLPLRRRAAQLYMIGFTRSADFPVVNAQQPAFGGGVCDILRYRCADAFIAKVGTGCTFSIAPARQAMGAGGGARTVTVTASSATCPWSATSGAAWITITAGAAGTGSGQVIIRGSTHTYNRTDGDGEHRRTPPDCPTVARVGVERDAQVAQQRGEIFAWKPYAMTLDGRQGDQLQRHRVTRRRSDLCADSRVHRPGGERA